MFKVKDLKEEGTIKLPLYQRDAIWSEGRICALWDSLLRGFPLPSFLLVKGKGRSREFQDYKLDKCGTTVEPKGTYYDILDGQQRINAIDSVCTYKPDSALRLWIDLAPKDGNHPFKFKYWIQSSTKVFPFGFQIRASGEHDFALLTDSEITKVWDKLQKDENLKGKEFYELSLDDTCPYMASCPVPLDELIRLIEPNDQSHLTYEDLKEKIKQLGNEYYEKLRENEFLEQPQELCEEMVKQVARDLEQLRECKFIFQLIRLADDKDEEITFFERIGRGGTPITQPQLAVSKLMLELEGKGNDAVAAIDQSKKLQHLWDTTDIIHGLARTAYFEAKKTNSDTNTRIDLDALSPAILKSIQKKDKELWDRFIEKLGKYCKKDNKEQTPCQQAFEQLYDNLLFKEKENPNGFSLVQIAQTDRSKGGIAPITLHPLLYWYLVYPEVGLDIQHREDMLRYVLFSNAFLSVPKNEKFNREVFQQVADNQKIDFNKIYDFVFSDENMRKDLGFKYELPEVNQHGEIISKPYDSGKLPTPKEVTCFSARSLILQNWPNSRLNKFISMWNQRKAMEDFYGEIKYRPALFSKGRPFDDDHIVARNRLLGRGYGERIPENSVKESINYKIAEFASITDLSPDDIKKSIHLSRDHFRKHFTHMCGNYRFWPKRLNRSDGDQTVKEKFVLDNIKKRIIGHRLKDKFNNVNLESLCEWSAILIDDFKTWQQLPPGKNENDPWNKELIGKFILVTLKRERFLYENAYNFITGGLF